MHRHFPNNTVHAERDFKLQETYLLVAEGTKIKTPTCTTTARQTYIIIFAPIHLRK